MATHPVVDHGPSLQRRHGNVNTDVKACNVMINVTSSAAATPATFPAAAQDRSARPSGEWRLRPTSASLVSGRVVVRDQLRKLGRSLGLGGPSGLLAAYVWLIWKSSSKPRTSSFRISAGVMSSLDIPDLKKVALPPDSP